MRSRKKRVGLDMDHSSHDWGQNCNCRTLHRHSWGGLGGLAELVGDGIWKQNKREWWRIVVWRISWMARFAQFWCLMNGPYPFWHPRQSTPYFKLHASTQTSPRAHLIFRHLVEPCNRGCTSLLSHKSKHRFTCQKMSM